MGSVFTSPIPPRPFTPAGVKGSCKSGFGGCAPNTVLQQFGCDAVLMGGVGARGGRRVGVALTCSITSSASAATRDTRLRACNVRASERARCPRFPTPFGRAEQRSSARIRAGACLSEASLRATPSVASSTGNRAAARPTARLSFAYFSLAKQRKVRRLPGRNPASHSSQPAT